VRPRWTSIASIRPSTAGSSVVNSPSDLLRSTHGPHHSDWRGVRTGPRPDHRAG
jgi:hypothetical protein